MKQLLTRRRSTCYSRDWSIDLLRVLHHVSTLHTTACLHIVIASTAGNGSSAGAVVSTAVRIVGIGGTIVLHWGQLFRQRRMTRTVVIILILDLME